MGIFLIGVSVFFWVVITVALKLALRHQPSPLMQQLKAARTEAAAKYHQS